MQKIIIIGAGPAGLLLAHYLLSRGNYRVEIYERRPDFRWVEQSKQRTFPVSLQTRGISAIREIPGLEKAIAAQGIWSLGSCLHSKGGKTRKIKRKTPLLLINRNRLTLGLLEKLLQAYDDDVVKVQFDCKCIGVNKTEQTVTLQPTEGEQFVVHFDRLVGADGARSQVRETLAATGDLNYQQEYIPDVYKSLFVSRFSPDRSVEFDESFIHLWTIEKSTRLLMAPQPDDLFHGTLIFPPAQNPLENLTTGQAVLDYFAQKAPNFRPLMTLEDAEALRQKTVSKIITVKCDRLNIGGQILLIGDAAHAVSPSMGQGCNSSLQDVMIFAQVLDEYQDDWDKALPIFTKKRLADVHALRELSYYAVPRSQPMSLEFIFRLTIGKKLRPLLPTIFPPLPMELVMEGETPYSEVLQQCQGWVNRVKRSMAN